MATLQELLDLLPDNDTGEIDAADLRTIVTELWNNTVDAEVAVINLGARVSELEAATGKFSITGRWQVNPQVDATPGDMQVTTDADTWSQATILRFSKFDQTGTDMTVALMGAETLYGQSQIDSSAWARCNVTGPAIDQGTYIEIPAEYVDGGGSSTTVDWQAAIVVFTWAA